MSAERFSAGRYTRQNEKKPSNSGSFNDRVTVVEGTRKPSRVRDLSVNPQAGNVHRSTVKEYVPHDLDHSPYTSAFRPEPSGGTDLGSLKKHQEQLLTKRQRSKNRSSKGDKG